MKLRPAVTADVPAIAALLRRSFAPNLHRYMIYTQAGIADYLRVILNQPALFPDHRLLTAEGGNGAVAGFAEFRTSGPTALLSYICVSPHAQRRGVATALIQTFLADHPGITGLELDTFEDNRPAVALYRKMGFTGTTRLVWLARPVPQPAAAAVRAINPASAIAAFDRYGFCELPVRWQGVEHRLGRIGPDVLRCFSPADYEDEALLAAVRTLIPELREALLIQPAEQAGPLAERQVTAALHLRLDVGCGHE